MLHMQAGDTKPGKLVIAGEQGCQPEELGHAAGVDLRQLSTEKCQASGKLEPQAEARHGLPGQQLCRKSSVIMGDSEHTLELTGATLELVAFGTAGRGATENGICFLISRRLFALVK